MSYGIVVPDWALDKTKLSQALEEVKLPEFLPKQGVKIVTDEKATSMNPMSMDDDVQIEQLIQTLEEGVKSLPPGFHMNPITFEKVC